MKIGIIYTSVSGNTKELAHLLHELFSRQTIRAHLFHIADFPIHTLSTFDAIAIGTYTWGDGDIPAEMEPLFREFEKIPQMKMITGVFGTGDSFYPHFCGAVDKFRDLLKINTDLAVTLKIELLLQKQDISKCKRFVELFANRIQTSCHS
ncbi:flavodoxin domain-containing protein [Cytobacillus praedii]|uniref:flavodoxin domain-containing protein n=1 Tax=Cytobacillus praedii TaxID=1742358 RepID=UPI002E1AE43F|nr:flavodoxin domain-containing protein [Cytobacillus praedii]MED3553381.1 flavodoxin domain-containing protein [Cytobacillus praedii]